MATDLGFATDIRIGSSVGSMEDVRIEPHVEFMQGGEETEKIVCGKVKSVGYPRCRWTYPNMRLTGEQFQQLHSLVGSEMSASVTLDIPVQTIDVTTYQPTIATYNAIMVWPKEGVTREMYNEWVLPDDGILFTNLEPA